MVAAEGAAVAVVNEGMAVEPAGRRRSPQLEPPKPPEADPGVEAAIPAPGADDVAGAVPPVGWRAPHPPPPNPNDRAEGLSFAGIPKAPVFPDAAAEASAGWTPPKPWALGTVAVKAPADFAGAADEGVVVVVDEEEEANPEVARMLLEAAACVAAPPRPVEGTVVATAPVAVAAGAAVVAATVEVGSSVGLWTRLEGAVLSEVGARGRLAEICAKQQTHGGWTDRRMDGWTT